MSRRVKRLCCPSCGLIPAARLQLHAGKGNRVRVRGFCPTCGKCIGRIKSSLAAKRVAAHGGLWSDRQHPGSATEEVARTVGRSSQPPYLTQNPKKSVTEEEGRTPAIITPPVGRPPRSFRPRCVHCGNDTARFSATWTPDDLICAACGEWMTRPKSDEIAVSVETLPPHPPASPQFSSSPGSSQPAARIFLTCRLCHTTRRPGVLACPSCDTFAVLIGDEKTE